MVFSGPDGFDSMSNGGMDLSNLFISMGFGGRQEGRQCKHSREEPCAIRPGLEVIVHGLSRTSEHNNKVGRIQSFDAQLAVEVSEVACVRGDDSMLRIRPVRGTAVVFRQQAGRHPLHVAWHGGCRVIEGEKVTLQKILTN